MNIDPFTRVTPLSRYIFLTATHVSLPSGVMAVRRNLWKEIKVYLWVMVPYALFMNILIQGGCILQGWAFMGINFLGTAIYLFLVYLLLDQEDHNFTFK